ncbi:hypothetical protein U9M48_023418 [Paspalum notatum var. saurae]|uniref:Uncharacterized protein n=1 Tax=Paspalum notatum var. saurae TaxID=547442 RepID=A0AAQ3WUP6_PASNO
MVKQWALKKMAIFLQTFKTKLWGNYVKHGKAPDFGKYPKLRGDWDFTRNRRRPSHVPNKIQKFQRKESIIITWVPVVIEDLFQNGRRWKQSSNNEGSTYLQPIGPDAPIFGIMDTGERAVERLVEAIEKFSKGEFVPEREKNELTWALENREHLGRTRGLDNVS